MPRVPRVIGSTLGVVLLTWLGFDLVAEPVPDVEVRAVGQHAHPGRLLRDWPLGQGFHCEGAGLARIEVLAHPAQEPVRDGLVLVLREGALDGPEVRRVSMPHDGLVRRRRFLSFEFEPLPESAGKTYWFQLLSTDDTFASDWTVWTQFRGKIERTRPWGDRTLEDTSLRASFRALQPDLTGINVPMERFDPRDAAPKLVLRSSAGDEVEGRLRPNVPTSRGYASFTFPPIADSRFREFELELELPAGTQTIGTDEGLSFQTFYGPWRGASALLGMARGDEVLADRDVFFRAFTSEGRGLSLARLRARTGARELIGVLVWAVAAGVLLAIAIPHRRDQGRVQP